MRNMLGPIFINLKQSWDKNIESVKSVHHKYNQINSKPCGDTGCNPEPPDTPGEEWTDDWSGFICLHSPSDGCREPDSSILDCVTAALPSPGSPELLACSLV